MSRRCYASTVQLYRCILRVHTYTDAEEAAVQATITHPCAARLNWFADPFGHNLLTTKPHQLTVKARAVKSDVLQPLQQKPKTSTLYPHADPEKIPKHLLLRPMRFRTFVRRVLRLLRGHRFRACLPTSTHQVET